MKPSRWLLCLPKFSLLSLSQLANIRQGKQYKKYKVCSRIQTFHVLHAFTSSCHWLKILACCRLRRAVKLLLGKWLARTFPLINYGPDWKLRGQIKNAVRCREQKLPQQMFTYISSWALGDIPYHYYFKLQVETINYMNSMENTVNKPKINQNKDRGHFLEM